MFERFTVPARTLVRHSMEEARELGHTYIGTEHLLLAMLRPEAGVAHDVLTSAGVTPQRVRVDIGRLMGTMAAPPLGAEDAAALRTIGIDLDAVLRRIEERFGADAASASPPPPSTPRRRGLLRRRHRPDGSPRLRSHLPLTNRAKKVLELSVREAVALGSGSIGTEHIVLGLLREGRGLAAQVLVSEGVALADLRSATLRALDRAA